MKEEQQKNNEQPENNKQPQLPKPKKLTELKCPICIDSGGNSMPCIGDKCASFLLMIGEQHTQEACHLIHGNVLLSNCIRDAMNMFQRVSMLNQPGMRPRPDHSRHKKGKLRDLPVVTPIQDKSDDGILLGDEEKGQ